MYRFLAILLIPIFLVGNSFAHSHGLAAHSSEAHGRAHIHVGKASHHDASHAWHDHAHGHSHHGKHQHSHRNSHIHHAWDSTFSDVPVEHDSDAIYLESVELALNKDVRVSVEVNAQALVHASAYSLFEKPTTIPRLQLGHSPPPRLPLYLLNAVLRL